MVKLSKIISVLWSYKLYPLLFLAIVVPIILTSNFYMHNLPNYNSPIPPKNNTLYYLTGSFNAYTESVSINSTQTNLNFDINLDSVLQNAFACFGLLLVFALLYKFANFGKQKTGTDKYSEGIKDYLPLAFFLSSVISQYALTIALYLFNIYLSGISGFLVDFAFIYGIFSALSLILLIYVIKIKIKHKSVATKTLFIIAGLILAYFFVNVFYVALLQFETVFFSGSGLAIHVQDFVSLIIIFSVFIFARKQIQPRLLSILKLQ